MMKFCRALKPQNIMSDVLLYIQSRESESSSLAHMYWQSRMRPGGCATMHNLAADA
jgi:hypothetical protein